MTSTEKQSVSSGRGGFQQAPPVDLLRSRGGALGGLTKEALERATGSPEIKGQLDSPSVRRARHVRRLAGGDRGGQAIRPLRKLHPSETIRWGGRSGRSS